MSDKDMEATASTLEKREDDTMTGHANGDDGKALERLDTHLVQNAARGTQTEHDLTFSQAAKKYPAAIGWTVLVCCACVMEGYDTAFIGALYAEPAFQKAFGVPAPGGGYQIEAKWQTALTLSGGIGIIIGSFLNGYAWEWIGMKRTMLAAYVAVTGLTFILVFADSLPIMFLGQILCGIPWGVFGTTAPTYASEVCPVVLRGYLGTFINITWIIGQLVSAGILRGVENVDSRWAYDILFAGQWIWPVPLFIGLWFCPESPWWLIRQNRIEDAKTSLRRLFNDDGVEERLAMMIHTHEREKEMETSTSYLECLRGVDLRRTEIAFMVMAIQPLSGLPLQGANTYFFEQAGLSVDESFNLSIAYYIIGFAGTVISWFLITWYGRRSIFLTGLAMMTTILFIIGFVALSPRANESAKWAQAVLLVVWVFIYDWSVGPLAFCLVSESSSTRLRAKTVAIGRNAFYLWSIIFSVVTPYMLDPTAGDWKGKSAFVYGGTCFCALVWTFFRLPEFKGRTFEELDILFDRKVNSRKFKETKVALYSEEELPQNV
jgi:SP family general alpha glucoside:H+ symporter-like MFS transporter